MNSESPIPQPSPESACHNDSDGGCRVSPQTVQGASRSVSNAQETEKTLSNLHPPRIPDRSLGTPSSHSFDDMGYEPPEMPAEPDYDGDYDYEEDSRERELLMDDLADDNDDFARSDEDGWYYSDEN